MGSLHKPPSLHELYESASSEVRTCLELSFPTKRGCNESVSTKNESYRRALKDLTLLRTEGTPTHDHGLIATLCSIACAFSCPKHQGVRNHVERFAYYWLALDRLPSLLICMGFTIDIAPNTNAYLTPGRTWSEDTCSSQTSFIRDTQSIVDSLDHTDAFLIHRAVQRLLQDKRWKTPHTHNNSNQFLSLLEAKLASESLNDKEKQLVQEAEQRWNIWHLARLTQAIRHIPDSEVDASGNEGSDEEDADGLDSEESETSSDAEPASSEISDSSEAWEEELSSGNPITSQQRPPNNRPAYSDNRPTTPSPRPLLDITSESAPQIRQVKGAINASTKWRCLSASQASKKSKAIVYNFGVPPAHRKAPELRCGPVQISSELGGPVGDFAVSGLQGSQQDNAQLRNGGSMTSMDEARSLFTSRPPSSMGTPPAPDASPSPRDKASVLDLEVHSASPTSSFKAMRSKPDGCGTSRTPVTSTENNLTPPVFEEAEAIIDFLPRFQVYSEQEKPIRQVVHAVFNKMKEDLSDKKGLDQGYIYILRLEGRPGYVKIGQTTKTIDVRKGQIKKCSVGDLVAINDDDFCELSNHTRVEQLVHQELQNCRRRFACACKRTKGKAHDCEGAEGFRMHGEWFEMEEAKAKEVVRRWRDWMNKDPYCDGILRSRERLRIEYYANDPERMSMMVCKESPEAWLWDRFMDLSNWNIHKFWIRTKLFGLRSERLTYSRWDSFWKHWQSNVLIYLTFFLFSLALFVLSECLSPSFAFVPVLSLINTVVLGSWAILYAA